MVFYRKYRPQLISELDLESVRTKLTSILSSDSIPHAFLFAGPKGLGKTSSARILAKAINCEQRLTSNSSQPATNKKLEKSAVGSQKSEVSIEPCNKCSACVSITNGSAVDVVEIDAASNRGIDEIRDLKERIKFSPSSLKTKIYIIDEVHMLTTEAFNALLKTLEEPPSHVVFILATTEMGKLPGTITSRTFYVPFQKPKSAELERSLNRVIAGENLDLEKGVLEKIINLSDGAFRDGAKILEDLALQSRNKKITLELLEAQYKSGSIDNSVEKIISFTLSKNTKDALSVIEELRSIQADFKTVIEQMADKLHAKLLDSVSQGKEEDITSTQRFLKLLDEAYKNMKGAVLAQLPLEMAVIGYLFDERLKNKQSFLSRELESSDKKIAEKKVITNAGSEHFEGEVKQSKSEVSSQKLVVGNDLDLFKKLLDAVNVENRILAALLRGSHLEVSENSAVLKPQSPFHMEKLSEQKNREIIEQKLTEVLGKKVAIEIKK